MNLKGVNMEFPTHEIESENEIENAKKIKKDE